jgi:mycothiol synthase
VVEATLRPAAVSDAEAIAEICNAASAALDASGDADAAEIRRWFELPDLELLVAERDGRVVGYLDIAMRRDGANFDLDVRLPPGERRSGLADTLVAAGEDAARSKAASGATVRGFAEQRDEELAGALRRAGYGIVRHSFEMHTELVGDLPQPRWPDGIAVRSYDHDRDEVVVYECVQEAFADHWDFHPETIDRWQSFALTGDRFDPGLWWLAEDRDDLAGVCLDFWHHSGDPTYGWVGTLCVRRPWRRRGLALAFLRHSFSDFAERGATQVGLGVDAANTTGAGRLYERAGMTVRRRSDTYEKRLA